MSVRGCTGQRKMNIEEKQEICGGNLGRDAGKWFKKEGCLELDF